MPHYVHFIWSSLFVESTRLGVSRINKGLCLFPFVCISGQQTSDRVECYIPCLKSWRAVGDMNIGRSAVSACTVTDINNARDFTYHGNRKMGNRDPGNHGDCPAAVLNSENSKWLVRWRRNTNQTERAR